MKKIWILFLLTGFLLASCISISSGDQTPTLPPQFMTSTLPPTKSLASLSTPTPSSLTTGTPTLAVTIPPDCTDQAVLLDDVTIPDYTHVDPGETFTKTWRFQNTGTCPWVGYSIVFALGDQMGAPDSAPIPQTETQNNIEISLDLIAPLADGVYQGRFTIHNANDEIVPIGTEKTFWVIITVGNPVPTSTDGDSNS